MKKLVVALTLLVLMVAPVKAETVTTCSAVYGGGEVCGDTTTTTVTETHEVIETGIGDGEAFQILFSILGAAALASLLYKLTYKAYIFG